MQVPLCFVPGCARFVLDAYSTEICVVVDVKKWMERGVVEKVVVSIESAEVQSCSVNCRRHCGCGGNSRSFRQACVRSPP